MSSPTERPPMFPRLPLTTDEMGDQAEALSAHIHRQSWLSGISMDAPAMMAIAAAMANAHLFEWWPTDPEDDTNTEEFLPVMWDDTYLGMLVRDKGVIFFEATTWIHPEADQAMKLVEIVAASPKITVQIQTMEADDEAANN